MSNWSRIKNIITYTQYETPEDGVEIGDIWLKLNTNEKYVCTETPENGFPIWENIITKEIIDNNYYPGELYTFGAGAFGALGDGTVDHKSSPIQVGALTDWKYIYGGHRFASAIKTDGTLWGWGYNGAGQIGDSTTISKSSPIQIGTDTNWKYCSSGMGETLAIKTDGTLWGWGNNFQGALLNLTSTPNGYISSPVQVGTDTDWKYLKSSNDDYNWSHINSSVIALKTDNTLWTWGDNTYGNLGDGTTVSKSSPVQVSNVNDPLDFTMGISNITIIKNNGTLWSTGLNDYGNLGDGTTVFKSSPVQIGNDTDWKMVSSSAHTLALKTDGTLWAWGYNVSGQLGGGTTIHRSSPVQIGTGTDWKYVRAGNFCSYLIKTDGTLWSFGYNNYGNLGDGTTVSKSSPVQVGNKKWYMVSNNSFYQSAPEIWTSTTIGIREPKPSSTDGLYMWGLNDSGQVY